MIGGIGKAGRSVGRATDIPTKLHAMTLRVGRWKKHFSDLQCKLMLSKGLNYCVEAKKMSIAGYLMTEKNLFLVLRNSGSIKEQLEALNEYLIDEIVREYRWKQMLMGKAQEYDPELGPVSVSPAFKRYPLVNHDVIKILCGKTIDSGYYSAEVEKLKDLTVNNNFCSLGNYKDKELIGPVQVDTEFKWEEG